MPSVSIFLPWDAPGDGGGVCSYAVLPLLLGRSAAKETDLVEEDAVEERARDGVEGDASAEVWARLTLLAGGCGGEDSEAVAALEMEGR